MVQMAFCDLSHTFHKQVTNVSQHVFVILLWGILTSPLIFYDRIIVDILSHVRGMPHVARHVAASNTCFPLPIMSRSGGKTTIYIQCVSGGLTHSGDVYIGDLEAGPMVVSPSSFSENLKIRPNTVNFSILHDHAPSFSKLVSMVAKNMTMLSWGGCTFPILLRCKSR